MVSTKDTFHSQPLYKESMERTEICPACGGDGEVVTSHRFTCYECNGHGKVTKEEHARISKSESEIQKTRDASLSAWEYRRMGG